ncbi:MAG: transporter substrate-binding domain-containing protein [Arsenophonus sp.]|nr:MAG: transporter substrate-binding domain-containing protein [Arsenophonus sp.]
MEIQNIKFFLFIILIIFFSFVNAEKIDEIQKNGIIKIAVFDSNPPFGFIDPVNNKLIGYDIDIANSIAKLLNVKTVFLTTNPANRIPLLVSNKVDLISANFTITQERSKKVEFSIPIFSTQQKFIARKGILKNQDDLKNLRIGADKGTIQEIRLKNLYPNIKVISYDNTPFSFLALRNNNVDAITQDDAKLIGLFSKLPKNIQKNYEISSFSISHEYQALAVIKGEKKFIDIINNLLLELEKNGEAQKIFNRWFLEEKSLKRNKFKKHFEKLK